MLKSLRLENFKSFKNAELSLGDLTVLVGTNASGKSNIRDAFRFLHGISRGYSIADIIGGKYEDGVQQWQGIRGGTKEIAYRGANSFAISVSFSVDDGDQKSELEYFIQLGLDTTHNPFPYIKKEHLSCNQKTDPIFEASFNLNHPVYPNSSQIHFLDYLEDYTLDIETDEDIYEHSVYDYLANHIPVLAQVAKGAKPYGELDREQFSHSTAKRVCEIALNAINEMRFLDLSPDVMRLPSFAGQNTLGDRGENLSSVMLDICRDQTRKAILLDWLQALTPMDAKDFDFPEDFTGKVLLRIEEASGQKTTAYSASDGTLRFLGLLAALLGNQRSRFYFFEEPENGIHPNRLSLLLQLMEQEVANGSMQIVITTHSPLLLNFLSPASLEYASLMYRIGDRAESRITKIMDIPNAREIVANDGLSSLLDSGWLEDAMYFLEDEEVQNP
ncbi:AAA family ATPase [Pseudanabaena sp. FACHB-1277]|uniref:AAA family ATPase n=1 Tax=Pseudanabaena cinerea FACHB-1277 TaxID=2949581 RepID=A0A926Z5D6_9CYAN|nr:ATP-binding protein [Pseudanabaena cinerea]MBD2150156.1 AAA family ATPase [Pseudanabaena cinerea FACHB-1277]